MKRIKILQFGNLPVEVLSSITEELRTQLEVITETSKPMKIHEDFYDHLRQQFDAQKVVNNLAKNARERVLAVTVDDIFAEHLNYVFGQAQMPGNAALVSVHRLDPKFYKEKENTELLSERTTKEAIHEVGHMYGLRHCRSEGCVMNLSNTISDVDRKGKEFCDLCKMELGIR